MSYSGQEESVEVGQPVELYRFANLEDRFFYTSGQQQFTYLGETYLPRPISRTEDRIESLQTAREIVVKLPATDPFVARYIPTVPAQQDTVKIFRFHTTDGGTPEVVQIFAGNVSNVAISKNNEAAINCRSRASLLARQIPRQTCRALCNHVLYDARCKVNNTSFQVTGTVSALSSDGLSITVGTSTSAFPATGLQLSAQLTAAPTFLLGGEIARAGLERRMIRATTNPGSNVTVISIDLPFAKLAVGTSVTLLAGCDHQITTCATKFANENNYGGFPWIPKKNVFQVGVTNS